jgi:hypothetical protein
LIVNNDVVYRSALMKLKLTGPKRQKLHDALLSAFPDREALERLASFGLDAQLNQISRGSTESAVILSMINHYENTIGQLEELIEAARRMNPTNPELSDFYEHAWLPLKLQVTRAASSRKQQNSQQYHTSTVKAKEKREIIHTDASESKDSTFTPGVEEKTEPIHRDTSTQQHEEKQENHRTETPQENAHIHARRADALLQQVYCMFGLEERPHEERPHEDECSLAIEYINSANEAMLQIPTELEHTHISNAEAYYELEEKRIYFSNELDQVIGSITNFSQTVSVMRQKDIQDKIDSLQRILKSIDSLIDQVSCSTD